MVQMDRAIYMICAVRLTFMKSTPGLGGIGWACYDVTQKPLKQKINKKLKGQILKFYFLDKKLWPLEDDLNSAHQVNRDIELVKNTKRSKKS